MAGALFSFDNYADSATITSTSSIEPALPLLNLKDRRIALKCRTVNKLTAFNIRVDFGAFKQIKLISLLGFNMTSTGFFLSSFSCSITASSTGFGVAPFSYNQPSVGIIDRPPIGMPVNFFHAVNGGAGATGRYWELNFTFGNFDSYYQAGRLWMGDGILIPEGVDNEWAQTIRDPSEITRSRGQQVYANGKAKYRQTSVRLSPVTRDVMFGEVPPLAISMERNIQEMLFIAGRTGEVIVIPRIGDGSNVENQFVNRTGMYGVFSDEPTIRKLAGDNYSVDLSIEECL